MFDENNCAQTQTFQDNVQSSSSHNSLLSVWIVSFSLYKTMVILTIEPLEYCYYHTDGRMMSCLVTSSAPGPTVGLLRLISL